MRGSTAKLIRRLTFEQLNTEGQGYPPVRHGVRKFKKADGSERYQFVIHPQCLRYQFKQLKKFIKGLSNAPAPKKVKDVGFGSRRKRRGQAIRASIPKFSRQGELIHNV